MDIRKRLLRKPVTTVFWILFVTIMTAFLTVSFTLYVSTAQLAASLDKKHTAIAVRSDPSVNVIRKYRKDATRSVESRTFSETDKRAIENMPGVKAVRSHSLVAGSSPLFQPIVNVRREFSWRSEGVKTPYYNAVFYGTLRDMRSEYDSRFYQGAESSMSLFLLFELENVMLLSNEFDEPLKNLLYSNGIILRIDPSLEPEMHRQFTAGEKYVIAGVFDPEQNMFWNKVLNPKAKVYSGSVSYFILDAGQAVLRDGCFESQSMGTVVWSSDSYSLVYDYSASSGFPVAEQYDGDPEAFFETTSHELWREYREAWQLQSHALPLIGTERLETMYAFLSGEALITEGRSFSEEEYEAGSKVIILSDMMAERCGIQVGDTIPLSQYLLQNEDYVMASIKGERLNNPTVGHMQIDQHPNETEDFRVVGLYHLEASWTDGTYAITPNTLFTPRKAQIPGGFGTIPEKTDDEHPEDLYGIYLSIELENGSLDDFQLALEQSSYIDQFYPFEQGFENVQKNMNGLAENSARLFVIALFGWALFALLYLLMFQSAEKHTMGTMRSLGVRPAGAALYLFGGGALIALTGTALGVLVSNFALKITEQNILQEALTGIDPLAQSSSAVMTEEALEHLILENSPTVSSLFSAAGCEFAVLCALLLFQAVILSRREPRRLMEG